MVLESLINPKEAEKKPRRLFLLGAFYASIGTFLGLWIFKNQASLVLVFLTVMATLPFMYRTIRYEEKLDFLKLKKLKLITRHSKVLLAFMFLFSGFVIAFSLWYIFLPDRLVNSVFSSQSETIRNINSQIVGSIIDSSATGNSQVFLQIVSNNIKVMLFAIFFSFFYGAGAIFILTWNASVIGTAVGNLFRNKVAALAMDSGFIKIGSYFGIFTLSILRYAIHGLFEILAYFVAGLAGGIISVAIIKHDFGSNIFKKVLADSINLIIFAIALVFLAAFIEVFITPLFF